MELYDSFGNQCWLVVIPTQPEYIFSLCPFYPIPPLGGEFLFNFSLVFKQEKDLGRINKLIEDGGLRVSKVEGNNITLHRGPVPGIVAPEPSAYMNKYYSYWYFNYEYSPFKEFPDPDLGVYNLVVTGEKEIRFTIPKLYPVPSPGGKFEINYEQVLKTTDLNYIRKLTQKTHLYTFQYDKEVISLYPGPPPGIIPNFNQSKQNAIYAEYWTRNPNFAPEYWLREPFSLTFPGEPDINLKIPGNKKIFCPGLGAKIDWEKLLCEKDWKKIKEDLEIDGPLADKWMDTKTIVHDRYAFNPDLWF